LLASGTERFGWGDVDSSGGRSDRVARDTYARCVDTDEGGSTLEIRQRNGRAGKIASRRGTAGARVLEGISPARPYTGQRGNWGAASWAVVAARDERT